MGWHHGWVYVVEEGPSGPVDPGYGVGRPMPPHAGGGPAFSGGPVDPGYGQGRPMPPHGPGGGGEHAEQLPSLPPGTTKPTPPGGGPSAENPIFLPAPGPTPPENVVWPPLDRPEAGLPPGAGTKPVPPEIAKGGGVYILAWIPGFGFRYVKVTLPPAGQPKPA